MMTMNAREITQKALDFQKGAFTCWYDALSIIQDQTALAVEKTLDQTSWIPDEGRRVISSWVGTCKNERDRYRVYMEESFSILEKRLAQYTKDAPAGSKKPATEEKQAAPVIKSKADAVEEKKASDAQETKQSIQ
jgi:hypothetical protein